MRSIKEYLFFYWKRASEKQSHAYFDDHFKDDIQRFKNSTEKKDQKQIDYEIKTLKKYWGCYPYQYFRYDLFRKDNNLTIEELKKYVPNFFAYNLFFPRSFFDYGILCEDKGLTYSILKAYNIAQPVVLFRFEKKKFYNEENAEIDSKKVNEIINKSTAKKIFIKPSFGLGGLGIFVFKRSDNHFINENNIVLDDKFFTENIKEGFYIIQEGIEQHEEMNKIYSHSVNTLRIFTDCVDGEARIMYSLIRMGQGGKQVDNTSSGGLYTKFNPENGKMEDFAFSHNRIVFDSHPDTGFAFKDSYIYNWEETKKFILETTKKFREIRYLGWDVAITKQGPMIIEINNGPGIELVQDFYNGIRDDLKIIPEKWWYNRKYTLKELQSDISSY